jgi:hypothetical protein
MANALFSISSTSKQQSEKTSARVLAYEKGPNSIPTQCLNFEKLNDTIFLLKYLISRTNTHQLKIGSSVNTVITGQVRVLFLSTYLHISKELSTRGHQMRNYSKAPQYFMKPEGSLQHSPKPPASNILLSAVIYLHNSYASFGPPKIYGACTKMRLARFLNRSIIIFTCIHRFSDFKSFEDNWRQIVNLVLYEVFSL